MKSVSCLSLQGLFLRILKIHVEKIQVFQNRKCYEITLPISSFLSKTENICFPSPLGMGVACANVHTERALFIRRPTRMAPSPRTQVSTALPSQWGCPPSADAWQIGKAECLEPVLLFCRENPAQAPNPPDSVSSWVTRKMKVYDAGLIKTVPQVLHPLPSTPADGHYYHYRHLHPLTWPFT